MSKRKGINGGWIAAGLALLAVGLVLLAAGCAPQVQVESNLNPDYQADLERVFVVIDTHKVDQATQQVWDGGNEFGGAAESDTTNFMKVFLPKLSEYFAEVGVEIKGHAVTGLELAPSAIDQKIAAFAPDAVLHIKESWFEVHKDPGILGFMSTQDVTAIDLDCSLTDDAFPDQVVWRAVVQVKAQPGQWKDMADELALSIVDKLQLDGLIDPAKRSTPEPKPGDGEA